MKLQLAQLLGKTRLAPALLTVRRLGVSPWVTVLGYHRAGAVGAATEYDDGVVDVTPEAFDAQLTFLKRWCNVVDQDQMLAFARGGKLPKNPVHITFDDGYLDNHDVVMPALQRHGLKATFFITTSYVEERRLFWWDRINFLVKASNRDALELDYPSAMRLPLGPGAAERRAAVRALVRVIKDHFALDLERFLEDVATAAGVSLSRDEERRRVDAMLMTWDHVRALRRGGMDVGSHTCTHRVLQTLPREDLGDELTRSKEVLEGVLGEPVRAISYPVGKPLGDAPEIRAAVRAAGYELGYTNCTGVNHSWSFDPLDAKRVSTDAAESEADFHAMIAVPYLAT